MGVGVEAWTLGHDVRFCLPFSFSFPLFRLYCSCASMYDRCGNLLPAAVTVNGHILHGVRMDYGTCITFFPLARCRVVL